MKERAEVLLLVFFFDAWGHWWGSGGASFLGAVTHGLAAMAGIFLILALDALVKGRHAGVSQRDVTMLVLSNGDAEAIRRVQRNIRKELGDARGVGIVSW